MPLVVVMGVSGSGKSSVGEGIAGAIGVPFIEGDALHPPANIEKMSKGIPLEDTDRMPWLHLIGAKIKSFAETGGAVATCSALKKSYREILRQAAGPELLFVHVTGEAALLGDRILRRTGHFMPPQLLASQLRTLETPRDEPDVMSVNCADPLETEIAQAIAFISARKEVTI